MGSFLPHVSENCRLLNFFNYRTGTVLFFDTIYAECDVYMGSNQFDELYIVDYKNGKKLIQINK